MNKLAEYPWSHEMDPQVEELARRHSTNTNVEGGGRLIVLVPTDSNYTAATRRIWELAKATGRHVQLLGLCKEAAQEPTLHRELVMMSALIQDGRVCAEVKIEVGTTWVRVLQRNYQQGDMIVCFSEQHAGLFHKPLAQILESNFNAPVYLLSGLSAQENTQPNWLPQILAWIGSLAIIVGAAFLQVRMTSLAQGWVQTMMLILSVIGEVGLIWAWNSLFP